MVAVIGILMGILLPALSSVRTKGKLVKGKADINTIMTACKQFEADYGVLPDPRSGSGAGTDWTQQPLAGANATQPYKNLFTMLTTVKYQDTAAAAQGTSDVQLKTNVRSNRYLEIPSTYSTTGYLDPFGYTYGIGINLSYSNAMTIAYDGTTIKKPTAGSPNGDSFSDTVNGSVTIYMLGNNYTYPSTGTTGSTYQLPWKSGY